MDNLHIEMIGKTREDMLGVMQYFERHHKKLCAYAVSNKNELMLCWTGSETESTELPYIMNAEQATDFIMGWLSNVKYPLQPDHGGHNKKGFRVSNNEWGNVSDFGWRAFAAVSPEWCMYGK